MGGSHSMKPSSSSRLTIENSAGGEYINYRSRHSFFGIVKQKKLV